MRTGRGLSPVRTLLKLVTGDWVGDVTAVVYWCFDLGVTIRILQGSRFLTSLVHTVIFTMISLNDGWILGGLESVRDI